MTPGSAAPPPVVNNSQNPVGYITLDEEAEFTERPCGCGCGAISTRDFLPGHDVRSMQDRVRGMFAGSALEFIHGVDGMADEHGVPVLAIRNPAPRHHHRPSGGTRARRRGDQLRFATCSRGPD
ncbi:hypothetical protein [Nocardia sp. R7R-8]|uniref:hypothetical protein n=1 Tax=Nocardia sp. R7R-8 TaxID=3459304 RepID=UPI00403DCE82